MPARQLHPASTFAAVTVDVVVLSTTDKGLVVLLERPALSAAHSQWSLPQDVPRGGETLHYAARRIARGIIGGEPSWLEQYVTIGNCSRGWEGGRANVAYLALVPGPAIPPLGGKKAWFSPSSLPKMRIPQSEIIAVSLRAARDRMDNVPIAFKLLPPLFTLAELQLIYEILLGRKIHKASFRRALRAARLVTPVKKWRSEGRGRPAQLYRYAPRRKRSLHRALRFDRLA